MTNPRTLAAAIILFITALPLHAADDWPAFRGGTQGCSDSDNLPVKWSETEGVKYKVAIPGEGWSSPVVLGDQVWMTTATDGGRSSRAICVDRDAGRIVYDIEVFHRDSPGKKNTANSYASPTPVLEKGRVYVSFGTDGTACLDATTGKVLWRCEELKLDHKEGAGSSPVLYKDLLVMHCDGIDVQYVVALDKNTGRIAWKTKRSADLGKMKDDVRKAYSTPVIANVDGADQIISVGAHRTYGYDAASGRELWFCDAPGYSNAPTPVFADGIAYITTGFNTPELWAIRVAGAKGDISKTGVVWKLGRGAPLKPSAILVGERLCLTSDSGTAKCLAARTGDAIWTGRLKGNYSASPVCAGGLIYFCNEAGLTSIVKAAGEFAVVTENKLDGKIMASPAIAGKSIFIRTSTHLYRIEL